MKFALINGDRAEATKGAKGLCPSCGLELIAKCGEVKVHHWAHKGNRNCDQWWENETDWHRSWKEKFPIDWQEIVRFDGSGEKHIADVKTQTGWALEFQHSYLNPEERRSRNKFYKKLVWVVDGLRRKTDKTQFQNAINESVVICEKPLIRKILFPEECRLFKEWHDKNALVFFDFQETQLWFLFPEMSASEVYISPFSQAEFIELHNNNKFDETVRDIILPICEILVNNKKTRRENNVYRQPNKLLGFNRHLARKRRRRL